MVAACVMTFEARDSAAKVVPARFKANLNTSVQRGSKSPHTSKTFQRVESKRTTSQTGNKTAAHKLDSSVGEWSPNNDVISKKAFTAAFVQVRQLFKCVQVSKLLSIHYLNSI